MFEQAFKNIDDVLRKEAGCTTELDYTEQTSWLLFLKYLDGLEEDKADEARLEGKKYNFILEKPYRWASWAAPKGKDGKLDHNAAMTGDDLRDFVNGKLFPYLHGFTASLGPARGCYANTDTKSAAGCCMRSTNSGGLAGASLSTGWTLRNSWSSSNWPVAAEAMSS